MLVDALDERRVVALVVGGDEAGRGGIGREVGHATMVPGRDRREASGPIGPARFDPPGRSTDRPQAGSPVPRQLTVGFQSSKVPRGLPFQTHAWIS